MTFEEILDQAIAMLQRRGRLTYGTLKRQFQLDDAALEDLKNELIEGQRLAVDERGNVLVWIGAAGPTSPALAPSTTTQEQARAELSTAMEMYQAMDMTFWLPQTEAALARVERAHGL